MADEPKIPPTQFDATGLKVLKTELGAAGEALKTGLVVGAFELASGGNKVKAVWESIKWAALTRAGLGGFFMLLGAITGVSGGLRTVLRETGSLQAAMEKLQTTKLLGQQFTQFLGSVDLAHQRVTELYQFVATSKFNLGEAAGASKILTIMSQGAEGGAKSLEMLGHVSTVTGVSLEDLAAVYGRLNAQTRNREDITASVDELKNMGIISEATAARLAQLQRTGVSSATVWEAVSEQFQNVSKSAAGAEPTFAELQDRYAKLRATMAEKFGAPFLEGERKGMENTIKLTEALTPAVEQLGKMLAMVTKPAEDLKARLGEVAGTDWFRSTIKGLTELSVIFPTVVAGWQVLKGIGKTAVTVSEVLGRGFKAGREAAPGEVPISVLMGGKEVPYSGVTTGGERKVITVPGEPKLTPTERGVVGAVKEAKAAVVGLVSPAAAAENLATTAMRLRAEQAKQLERQLLATKGAEEALAKAVEIEKDVEIATAAGDAEHAAALAAEAAAARTAAAANTLAGNAAAAAAVKNQVAAVAAEGGSKIFQGLSVALGGLGRGFFNLIAWAARAAPTILVLSGIAALATKAWNLYSESVERASHAADMAKTAREANEKLKEQIALLTTMDDHTKLVTQSREALNTAIEEQAKVEADVRSTEEEKSAAAAKVTAARRDVRQLERMDTGRLAPGAVEIERLQRQVALQKEIRNIIFEAEFARASGAKQVLMLNERIRDNMKIVAEHEKTRGSAKDIADAKEAVVTEEKNQKIKLQGIQDSRANLEKYIEEQKESQKVGSIASVADMRTAERAQKNITDAQAKIADLSAQEKTLRREGTPEARVARERVTRLQEGPEAPEAERFEAAAKRAEAAGDKARASELRRRSEEARAKSPEEAEAQIKRDQEQTEAFKRQGVIKGAELDTQQRILDVTQETSQAQDKIAQARIAGLERQRSLTVDIGERETDPVLKKQRDNQIREIEQAQQQERKGIEERGAQRAREKQALDAAIEVRKQNDIALEAAAKGHFKEADDALIAARNTEDHQHDIERDFELLQAGYDDQERATIIAAEATQRHADREAKAAAFVENETQRIELRKQVNTAMVETAKGHFAQAAAAMKAAQAIEDKQADIDRARELEEQGIYGEVQARILAKEKLQRAADREAKAQVYQEDEGRRIREIQLKTAERGIQPVGPGAPVLPTGGAARTELQRMKDMDVFRELLGKAQEAMGPGKSMEAMQLATQGAIADIQSQTVRPGLGAIADSLTRVGGGGGFYAGATADPQLQETKRISGLMQQIYQFLTEEAKMDVPVS